MAGYADTPLTGAHFAAFCEKMVGQPYWYGACCYKATQSLLNSKSKQYPGYYTAGRMDQCQRDIAARAVVADCIGGVKGYAWTNGGASILAAIGTDAPILSKYGANGCPDKGANGMFTYAKSKGCPWGRLPLCRKRWAWRWARMDMWATISATASWWSGAGLIMAACARG